MIHHPPTIIKPSVLFDSSLQPAGKDAASSAPDTAGSRSTHGSTRRSEFANALLGRRPSCSLGERSLIHRHHPVRAH